jgi:hypothetical protein
MRSRPRAPICCLPLLIILTENKHKLLRGKQCRIKFKKKGKLLFYCHSIINNGKQQIGTRGRDRMVVGFIAN